MENELLVFQEFLHKLPEHTQIRPVDYADFELVKFFAHFGRVEIRPFVERLEKAIDKSRRKEFELIGNLRNVLRNYIVLFLSSQYDVCIPNEIIKEMVPVGTEIDTILQIVVDWVNDEEYRIDFHHYEYN